MSFPGVFASLKEMAKKWALEDPLPKQVFRKAGLHFGLASSAGPPTWVLWGGMNYARQELFAASRYEGNGVPKGTWFYPSYSDTGSFQNALWDFREIAYVRVQVNWDSWTMLADEGAMVPIYSTNLQPSSRADWLFPDGITMQDWHDQIQAGTEVWPPLGAARDLITAVRNPTRSPWSAPPEAVAGEPGEALLSVCAVLRPSPARTSTFVGQFLTQGVLIQGARAPVSAAFTERFLS